MKRFTLMFSLLALVASATTPAPTMDPAPGVLVGQETIVTNRTDGDISISGTTLIRLESAVILGAGKGLKLVWDGANWVRVGTLARFSNTASLTWDFPSLSNGTTLGTPCSETDPVSVPGAVITDGCNVASNLGLDGGALLLSTATLSCTVSAAAAATVKLCVQFTDGGSYNLTDAGFTVRIFR